MASPFKIGFDIADWKDILPVFPDDYSKVINADQDNIYKQVWVRQEFPHIITNEFILQEADRIKNGVWILIKGMPIWIPPNYYQFLQYGVAGGEDPQFRLKRLKNVYTKIRVRMNPRFMGTYNIKNRQDGDTTMSMSDNLWEIISGNLNNGLIGIQSKTRDDALNPCWFALTSHWNSYPKFFKDTFYPHFVSGTNIAEKLKFSQAADPNNPKDRGKNVEIFYGPSKHNAFDGKNNMRKVVCDEAAKWELCSLLLTITNYKKFIMPGKVRKGLFDIFTSPSDTNGRWNDEAFELWLSSNPDELQETGSTKSRIYRMYSNPLDGIEGFYDEFGDADPQEIYEHILRERKSKKADELMAEVRAFPLPIIGTDRPDENEIFSATDSQNIFINIDGIKSRRKELAKVKDSKVAYGIYTWPNNIEDSGTPVWVTADKMGFDNFDARFVIVDKPNLQEVPDLKKPPKISQDVWGVDPFNLRYNTKNQVTGSLGAGICWRFRDLQELGKVDFPSSAYYARPTHFEIFAEDMIKAAVARQAPVQYENSNDKLENFFEDRGYDAYMIPSANAKPVEVNGEFKIRKGDSPAGRGALSFLNEGISLINGHLNKPIIPTDFYSLSIFDISEILEDLEALTKENLQFRHLSVALMQALRGKTKLLFQKKRKKQSLNDQMVEYLLD